MPLKILKNIKMNKSLGVGVSVKLPGKDEFAKILRDKDEIAVEMGEASFVDGVIVHKKGPSPEPVPMKT